MLFSHLTKSVVVLTPFAFFPACTGPKDIDSADSVVPDEIAPLDVDGEHYGTDYETLAVDWFYWILNQPVTGNPAYDATGADCANGQPDDVWFLAGAFNGATADRTCTVPADRPIFLPLINLFDCTWYYTSAGEEMSQEELAEIVAGLGDLVVNPYLQLDGAAMANPENFRVGPLPFSISLPAEDNILQGWGYDISGTLDECVGDGFWMMFDPLPAGEHTMSFGGSVDSDPSDAAVDFSLDFAYTLQVQ